LTPGIVDAHHLAADHGTLRERRIQHAGDLHVDAVFGLAGDLAGGVQPVQRLADVAELGRILQLHFLRRRQLRGRFGQRAVTGFFALIGNKPILRLAVRRAHAPLLRRGFREHGARLRTRDAQLFPAIAHRSRAARELRAEHAVDVGLARRREIDLDLA
jgi:hypothetical protein